MQWRSLYCDCDCACGCVFVYYACACDCDCTCTCCLDLDLDLDLGIVINDRNTPCQRFKSVVVRGLVNKARAKADLRS